MPTWVIQDNLPILRLASIITCTETLLPCNLSNSWSWHLIIPSSRDWGGNLGVHNSSCPRWEEVQAGCLSPILTVAPLQPQIPLARTSPLVLAPTGLPPSWSQRLLGSPDFWFWCDILCGCPSSPLGQQWLCAALISGLHPYFLFGFSALP